MLDKRIGRGKILCRAMHFPNLNQKKGSGTLVRD